MLAAAGQHEGGVLDHVGALHHHGADRRASGAVQARAQHRRHVAQLLLGHSKLESTVRYLGIEVDDALEISEQTEI